MSHKTKSYYQNSSKFIIPKSDQKRFELPKWSLTRRYSKSFLKACFVHYFLFRKTELHPKPNAKDVLILLLHKKAFLRWVTTQGSHSCNEVQKHFFPFLLRLVILSERKEGFCWVVPRNSKVKVIIPQWIWLLFCSSSRLNVRAFTTKVTRALAVSEYCIFFLNLFFPFLSPFFLRNAIY